VAEASFLEPLLFRHGAEVRSIDADDARDDESHHESPRSPVIPCTKDNRRPKYAEAKPPARCEEEWTGDQGRAQPLLAKVYLTRIRGCRLAADEARNSSGRLANAAGLRPARDPIGTVRAVPRVKDVSTSPTSAIRRSSMAIQFKRSLTPAKAQWAPSFLEQYDVWPG